MPSCGPACGSRCGPFLAAVYYAYANPHSVAGPVDLHDYGPLEAVQLYFTAYLIEYSLSLDNIVVMALIFTHFCVPLGLQHRVLFWGVLGAIVMRFLFILAGSALLSEISWVSYVFGGLLLLAARMLFAKEGEFAPEKTIWVRGLRRPLPVHDHFEGSSFFTAARRPHAATRLFVVLLLSRART